MPVGKPGSGGPLGPCDMVAGPTQPDGGGGIINALRRPTSHFTRSVWATPIPSNT